MVCDSILKCDSWSKNKHTIQEMNETLSLTLHLNPEPCHNDLLLPTANKKKDFMEICACQSTIAIRAT